MTVEIGLNPISTVSMVAEVGLEPHDLRVMSPTSYQLLYPASSDTIVLNLRPPGYEPDD